MAAAEFFFALEFSSQGVPPDVLAELASRVLAHVGAGPRALPGFTDALNRAVVAGSAAGARRCDVQFRAHAGTLDILVSSNGGPIWQTSLPIQ